MIGSTMEKEKMKAFGWTVLGMESEGSDCRRRKCMEAYDNCHTSTTQKSGTKGKTKKRVHINLWMTHFLVHMNISHNCEARSTLA